MAPNIPTLLRAVLFLAMAGLPACQHPKTAAAPQALPPAPGQTVQAPLFEWKGAELSGPLAVNIDLGEQKAQLMRGGQPASWTYVATGTSSHPTPTGSFRVTEKVQDKHSTSWGKIVDASGDTVNHNAKNGRDSIPNGGRFVGAPMPYWMRVNGAIGMHAGPIPNPGSPASHGCIRLPREMAEILFGVAQVGTPVQITY